MLLFEGWIPCRKRLSRRRGWKIQLSRDRSRCRPRLWYAVHIRRSSIGILICREGHLGRNRLNWGTQAPTCPVSAKHTPIRSRRSGVCVQSRKGIRDRRRRLLRRWWYCVYPLKKESSGMKSDSLQELENSIVSLKWAIRLFRSSLVFVSRIRNSFFIIAT